MAKRNEQESMDEFHSASHFEENKIKRHIFHSQLKMKYSQSMGKEMKNNINMRKRNN